MGGGRRRHGGRPQDGGGKATETHSNQAEGKGNTTPSITPIQTEIQNPHPPTERPGPDNPQSELVKSVSDAEIARWTQVLGISTIVLALATIGTACILYRTDGNIEKQASLIKDQLDEIKADRRPWVFVGDIATAKNLTFDNEGATFALSASMKNSGKSLAKGINQFVATHMAPLPSISGTPQQIRAAFEQIKGNACASPGAIKDFDSLGGGLLMPGDVSPPPPPDDIIPAKIPVSQFILNQSTKETTLWISTCIAYLDDTGNPHGTSFITVYSRKIDGRDSYLPQGEVVGNFQVHPFSLAAY
jgi:hypothetical protein